MKPPRARDEMTGSPNRSRSRWRIEWPTVTLALTIYGLWLAFTFYWAQIPYPLLFLAGGWVIAWHGSLQHEVLHGHPTRFRRVNDIVGWPPISLWLPYRIYKQSHLQHHHDEWLTDPIEDPESYYLTGTRWEQTGAIGRLLLRANNTLAGRLILGPLVALAAFFTAEANLILGGDRQRLKTWIVHLLGCAGVLFWVLAVCEMPLWIYLTAFVYSGIALSRLRSFAEHRYAGTKEERTAIVENTPLFGLLFLHNNLHIVHHSWPQVPWYDIPTFYRTHRQAFISLNGGLVYRGYADVARRYLFRSHHEPVHPQHVAPGTVEPVRVDGQDQAIAG